MENSLLIKYFENNLYFFKIYISIPLVNIKKLKKFHYGNVLFNFKNDFFLVTFLFFFKIDLGRIIFQKTKKGSKNSLNGKT